MNPEKKIQCEFCPQVLTSRIRYARHILAKHSQFVEAWIRGDSREIVCYSREIAFVYKGEAERPLTEKKCKELGCISFSRY